MNSSNRLVRLCYQLGRSMILLIRQSWVVGMDASLKSRRYTSWLSSLVSLVVCYVSRSVGGTEKESTILVVSLGCYFPNCTLWQSYFGSLAFSLNVCICVCMYACLSICLSI